MIRNDVPAEVGFTLLQIFMLVISYAGSKRQACISKAEQVNVLIALLSW